MKYELWPRLSKTRLSPRTRQNCREILVLTFFNISTNFYVWNVFRNVIIIIIIVISYDVRKQRQKHLKYLKI